MPNESHPKQAWVDIAKYILSFAGGVIIAAFILGRNSQKINDVVQWKAQIAPIIERMDSKGSLSFDHFHAEYLREQARIEKRLEKLEEKDP